MPNDEKKTLMDGSPVTPDHRELKENGQQKDYVVLSEEERAKGFVRPVRDSYLHVGLNPEMSVVEKTGYALLIKPGAGACGTRTGMHKAIAETYARVPEFYGSTFCVNCKEHFPVDQFVWEGTNEQVGS